MSGASNSPNATLDENDGSEVDELEPSSQDAGDEAESEDKMMASSKKSQTSYGTKAGRNSSLSNTESETPLQPRKKRKNTNTRTKPWTEAEKSKLQNMDGADDDKLQSEFPNRSLRSLHVMSHRLGMTLAKDKPAKKNEQENEKNTIGQDGKERQSMTNKRGESKTNHRAPTPPPDAQSHPVSSMNKKQIIKEKQHTKKPQPTAPSFSSDVKAKDFANKSKNEKTNEKTNEDDEIGNKETEEKESLPHTLLEIMLLIKYIMEGTDRQLMEGSVKATESLRNRLKANVEPLSNEALSKMYDEYLRLSDPTWIDPLRNILNVLREKPTNELEFHFYNMWRNHILIQNVKLTQEQDESSMNVIDDVISDNDDRQGLSPMDT